MTWYNPNREPIEPVCHICGCDADRPVTCGECGAVVCRNCGTVGRHFIFRCKDHKPNVSEFEIDLVVMGWRATRKVRVYWYQVEEPEIERTEIQAYPLSDKDKWIDAGWLWDLAPSQVFSAMDLALRKEVPASKIAS